MAIEKIVNAVIACRRDNDYNYAKVATTFIPKSGEICLVDTSRQGLCAIVGDGSATYGDLLANGYVNDIFVKGYLYNGSFYKDSEHSNELTGNTNKLYINLNNVNELYYWSGETYILVGVGNLPVASAETAGVLKLYKTTGNSEDGTMTQKSITEELGKKVSATVAEGSETIVFSFN